MATGSFETFDSVSRRVGAAVHSCDYCRLRKIKCKGSTGQSPCDACVKNRLSCTYQKRDQYFAARQTSAVNYIDPSGSAGAGTYSLGVASISSFNSTAPIAGAQATGLPAIPALVPAGPSPAEFPPPALMPHFIELFFKYNSQSLPFLSYESVVTSFLCSTLSPLLSNAIASIATKYSATMPQLAAVNPAQAPEYFARQARNLVQVLINTPSPDTLASLVLLAFFEYQAGRPDGMRYYAQAAANMAVAVRPAEEVPAGFASAAPLDRQQLLIIQTLLAQLLQQPAR